MPRYLSLISIHAPRKGSDFPSLLLIRSGSHFYPRSPQGERLLSVFQPVAGMVFLSTLPARGATRQDRSDRHQRPDFYPRSPQEERLPWVPRPARPEWISIHAPRKRSDPDAPCAASESTSFLSTLPARGATSGLFQSFSSWIFLSTLPARGATVKSNKHQRWILRKSPK